MGTTLPKEETGLDTLKFHTPEVMSSTTFGLFRAKLSAAPQTHIPKCSLGRIPRLCRGDVSERKRKLRSFLQKLLSRNKTRRVRRLAKDAESLQEKFSV